MNLLENKAGRSLAVFGFYFAEGVPIGFIWWALPTLMRQQQVSVEAIGSFTALLTLPWVFKFLWAPLIDIFRTARFGFVKWIAMSQTLMCLSLVPLLFIPLNENIITWGVCLFLHSLFAATQDVSVDALVINLSVSKEKGTLNGFMQAGMLLGRSLFGGVVLIFAEQIGLHLVAALMIMSILITMSLLLIIREPPAAIKKDSSFRYYRQRLLSAFIHKNTWYCIGFALTAAAAFEAAGAFAGPFFTDRGIAAQQVGFFFTAPVVAAMLLGGLAGGYLSDHIHRKRAVGIYLGAVIVMVATIAMSEIVNPDMANRIHFYLYTGMYLFTGMFTAASYALFMEMTDPELGATQFSSFMAATNGCEAWVLFSTGIVVANHGYSVAFLIMCMVSVLGLLLLNKVQSPVQTGQQCK